MAPCLPPLFANPLSQPLLPSPPQISYVVFPSYLKATGAQPKAKPRKLGRLWVEVSPAQAPQARLKGKGDKGGRGYNQEEQANSLAHGPLQRRHLRCRLCVRMRSTVSGKVERERGREGEGERERERG